MSLIIALATRLKLPPWLVEVILAGLLILAFALYERHKGAEACHRADERLAAEQQAHNRDLKAKGTTTVSQEAHDFHEAIAAPVARPVRLRVCPPSRKVPTAGTAGSISDGSAGLREPDHPEVVSTESSGPELQMIGKRADAQIAELQHYILNVCSKR